MGEDNRGESSGDEETGQLDELRRYTAGEVRIERYLGNGTI